MTAQVESALLLAAGQGSRFEPEGEALPKCLIEVGGKSLLQRLCENLRANGFSRLVIVTGFMADRVAQAAHEFAGELRIETVHNPDFATTNNVYSLWLARDCVAKGFLLVEGDLLFGPQLIAACLIPDRIVVSERLPWMNGTTLDIAEDGTMRCFYLLRDSQSAGQYKTVNVYSFGAASWSRISDSLSAYIASGATQDYYEAVLAAMHERDELQLHAVIYPKARWYEIDTAADLMAAQQLLLDNPQAFG